MDRNALLGDVLAQLGRRYRQLLDKTTVYPLYRWLALAVALALFAARIYALQGWFIVTYGLGIFILNLFIGFITPLADPDADGPDRLPVSSSEAEFKPFARKLPEFKFWEATMRATVAAFCMTLTRAFDIPVFWPILVIYFTVLLVFTLRDRLAHMLKHRYIPCSWGKKKYAKGPGAHKAAGGAGGGAGGAPEAVFRGQAR